MVMVMSKDSRETPDAGPDHELQIVRRKLAPNPTTAEYDFLEIIAELEGRAIDELPSLYDEIDHFIELLFKNPPSPKSQLELEFSYNGYRVSMDQSGHVKLVDAMWASREA